MTSVQPSAAVRTSVHRMVERLGAVRVIATQAWQPFVDRLMLGQRVMADPAAALVVGPLAAVLRHAAQSTDDFGFVMPVAQIARPWQRASNWRDDATLELWRAGWTTIDVDRILIASDDATFEFAIGNARRTPAVDRAEG